VKLSKLLILTSGSFYKRKETKTSFIAQKVPHKD
jgi:hypothetical protein